MFAELHALPVAAARIFMVYGPAQSDALKLTPYLYNCSRRGEPPRLSSGAREVDWIFVDDVVDGSIALADSSAISRRETVDLGSGVLVSARSFVESFARVCEYDGAVGFGELRDRPIERIRVANVVDSESTIAWRPRTRLEDGFRQAAAWLEQSFASQREGER
jgi:nucleoside-diphosphate-sugar epimerase